MKWFKVNNLSEYRALLKQMKGELLSLRAIEDNLTEQFKQQGAFYFNGYSWPLGTASQFLIDNRYSESGEINWRERLVCKKTKLNNRIRGAIHVFEQLYEPKINDLIYLTEQHSKLYKWCNKKYQHVSGSEYLTDSNWFNRFKFRVRLFPDTLVHQDLTQLNFPNNAFQYVLSFDCFEHIPDYQAALREICRVSKVGGSLIFSVPFDCDSTANLIRASSQQGGEITHHVEPEYHGNPVSKKGSLSFYTFGWELLDDLLDAGFNDAYAVVYWSEEMAYLGGPQLLLCADK